MSDQTAMPWRRHELVRVMPDAWAAALAARALEKDPMLSGWADHGWPVVVRRRTQADGENVPVGVPLPPNAGKARVAVSVPHQAVIARTAPPRLRTLVASAPQWQPTLAALVALGECHAVEPRAFGSLLWEHVTGLPYLSATSDLDLIWPVHGACNLLLLLDGIAQIEASAPMRIDGEVVFSDGAAANWRELHNALAREEAAEVLIKTMGSVHFAAVGSLPGCGCIQ
jgi:phosphoribosyl-dephospho-CoA transferase